MTCEQFQIDIERDRHGALPDEERTALRAHLGNCSSCSAYEQVVGRTEATMTMLAKASLERTDWEKVREGARLERQRQGRKLWTVALFFLATFVVVAIFGHATSGLLVTVAITLVAAFLLDVGITRWGMGVLERVDAPVEMLGLHRIRLREQARFLGWFRWVVLGGALGLPVYGYLRKGPPAVLVTAALGALVLTLFIRMNWWDLPRARREAAELNPDVRP
jgi:predicted anti-sigma-YlaC factor YlaD